MNREVYLSLLILISMGEIWMCWRLLEGGFADKRVSGHWKRLMSLIGGLDEPKSGEILYEGQSIMEKGKGLAWHRRNNVAFVFQNYNLIEYMTPKENVLLTAKEDPMPILKSLGISEEEAGRNVLKLSGGQQQRVAIARALASHAPVILADEPTGNLDEDTAAEITQILKDNAHKQGRCVIVVTHSEAVANEADVVLKLDHGKIIEVS